MDKIKRFIDCGVPTFSCNLRCHYCYVAQNYEFTKENPKFIYEPSIIGRSLSKERLGGVCLFNICASGETLIPNEVMTYTKAILEQGHYVMIVTNLLISKRIKEFQEWPAELRGRLFFKVSFHFLELKRLNLFNKFFDNIDAIRKMGASFTLEMTPTDEVIPYIDEIKEMCIQRVGAWPHVSVARDESKPDYPILSNLSEEEYIKTWSVFKSEFFDFKIKIFGEKRKEYCYAGNWSWTLNLLTGTMKQCYCTNYFTNIYRNPEKPIKFVNIGHGCKAPHCHNGHAFLTIGSIPELDTPYYAELRNRVCVDGSEWLTPQVKALFSTKMEESNEKHQPAMDVLTNNIFNVIYHIAIWGRSILKWLRPSFKSHEKSK